MPELIKSPCQIKKANLSKPEKKTFLFNDRLNGKDKRAQMNLQSRKERNLSGLEKSD